MSELSQEANDAALRAAKDATLPRMDDACKDCVRAGHVCQAMVFVDGDPLCLTCADGQQCAHAGTWRPVQSYVIRGEDVRMTEGVVMGPEFIDPWACRPGERPRERADGRPMIPPNNRPRREKA